MTKRSIRRDPRWLVPAILATALTATWAATLAHAAEAQLNVVSDRELEITGGAGKQAWRLRYGRLVAAKLNPRFTLADGNRAWFSHAGWLRLIDTGKGTVTGRWHFPGDIVRLAPQGTRLQIEVEERLNAGQTYHRIVFFDPAAPRVPWWPTNWVLSSKLPLAEVQSLLPASFSSTVAGTKVSADEAKKAIPELEEVARRDPHAPWFQVLLGRALKDIGDARAAAVLRQGVQVSASDYTELLPISVFLDKLGEPDLATEAFERGYKNFWERGNDPRMFTTLLSRLMVYAPGNESLGQPESKQRRECIERMYRLTPYGEAADLAWGVYADYMNGSGQAAEAQLWRSRADEARRSGALSFWSPGIGSSIDQCILIVFAVFISAGLYCLVMAARYRPQHRFDVESRKKGGVLGRFPGLLNSQYWTRRERVALFSMVFVGWYTCGLAQEYIQAIFTLATMPISIGGGSYAGPANIAALESRLRGSPERDLMVALAYQQDGQRDKAAGLYRALPEFPESWNNLGVILKEAGKDDEARAAFEKALQLDPSFAEAALNLGRPPSNYWTEIHQKYVPDRPMLSPPRGKRQERALLGGSPARLYLRALAGPFAGGSMMSFLRAIRSLG